MFFEVGLPLSSRKIEMFGIGLGYLENRLDGFLYLPTYTIAHAKKKSMDFLASVRFAN